MAADGFDDDGIIEEFLQSLIDEVEKNELLGLSSLLGKKRGRTEEDEEDVGVSKSMKQRTAQDDGLMAEEEDTEDTVLLSELEDLFTFEKMPQTPIDDEDVDDAWIYVDELLRFLQGQINQ